MNHRFACPVVERRIILPVLLAGSSLLVQSAEPFVRRAPPAGIAIAAADRAELEAGAAELGKEIGALDESLKTKHDLLALLPDVQILHKAVQWPLVYDEFLRNNDVAIAKGLLRQGLERAKSLREGKAPWLTAMGLVVRGYVSKIDGSVQPYGLVVPASFQSGAARKHRLDVWLHGRDNNLTELKFIADRQRSPGEFAPPDTLVLHPYGRYCNAFKFDGEVDVFEALEHVRTSYPIDESRIAVRGFSMGGAGCWHLAAHHPGVWAAAAPGAGFAETAEYTGTLAKDPKPPWWEQKLWHLYDATDYAANFFNLPVIAYSGELDKQKQAADMMARAMKAEGLELTHLIGPGVEHKYEPKTKQELARRFDELLARGKDRFPAKVNFTTWTLRYNRSAWVTVEGLQKHWERVRVEAELTKDHVLNVQTENVSAVAFSVWETPIAPLAVMLDGQTVDVPKVRPSGIGTEHFVREDGKWRRAPQRDASLRKRPGLQGPVDDAFMDRFLIVRPTGKPMNEELGAWVATELAHATNEWRAQFRGEARVKDDTAVTEADIAGHHLVLWGDPQSNQLLARIADKLPIRWDAKQVGVGNKTFSAGQHVPVLIYPNPLSPRHYVVLNSGFTFCEFGHLSNALQTPKLPDWAVVDITVPIAARQGAGIVVAGFFDERWQLSK